MLRLVPLPALAAALLGPALATAQETLDPSPATWRGLQFGPEQVLEGDYTVNVQTSTFHADGAPNGEAAWLEGWPERPGDDGGIVRRYHIRFVGRITAAPGRYGPGGGYGAEVLVDRLVSARLLIGAGG